MIELKIGTKKEYMAFDVMQLIQGCLSVVWQYWLWSFKTGGTKLVSVRLRVNVLNGKT